MPEESRTELLRRLHASRRLVTPGQLERWSEAGKVARPKRRHLAGVRGSVSYFPPEAFGQAAAMFDAARQGERSNGGDRRLDERGFLVWWSGRPIAEDARALLLAATAPMFKATDRIRTVKRTLIIDEDEPPDNPEDDAFDVAAAYFEQHQNEPIRSSYIRRLRRNVGGRADFGSVVVAVLAIALGGQPFLGLSPLEEEEPSLASLILKAFGAHDFPSHNGGVKAPGALPHGETVNVARGAARDQNMLGEILEGIRIFTNRERLREFVLGLSDGELEAAHKYAHMLFEELPVIFEAHEVFFGRNKFAGLIRAFTKQASTTFRAYGVVAAGWLSRKFGTARFESLFEQCQRELPRARAICTLARAFPGYRKLLLTRNAQRLAELSEETRSKMLETIKSMIAQ